VVQIDLAHTTFIIDADQNVTGSAGCNRFQAQWVDKQFEPVAMQCNPKLLHQEQAFLEALANIVTFISQPNRLLLKDAEDRNLARFSPRQLPRY